MLFSYQLSSLLYTNPRVFHWCIYWIRQNLLNSLRVICYRSLALSQWKSCFSLMIFHMAPRGSQTKVTTQIRETSLTRITSTMENVLILLCLYRRKARHAGRHMFPHTRTILWYDLIYITIPNVVGVVRTYTMYICVGKS